MARHTRTSSTYEIAMYISPTSFKIVSGRHYRNRRGDIVGEAVFHSSNINWPLHVVVIESYYPSGVPGFATFVGLKMSLTAKGSYIAASTFGGSPMQKHANDLVCEVIKVDGKWQDVIELLEYVRTT